MVGSPYRTLIEHGTGSAGVSFEDGMEGAVRGIVGTEDAVIYGLMAQGTGSDQALCIKLEAVSSHYLIGESRTVDRGDELDVLFFYLQCRRDGRIAAVREERVGFVSGCIKTFYDRKSLPDIGPGGTMNFIVGDDLLLSFIVAGLGNVGAVSRPFVATGGVGVIGGLQSRSFGLLLDGDL
jgi:hypothetical protein